MVLVHPTGLERRADGGRVLHDRRRQPTPMLSRHALLGGRRRSPRRRYEVCGSFVDVHGTWLFVIACSIVALNVLDAWFTALFLSHGGEELNPLVLWVLGQGTWAFIAVKSVGIGICVSVLTLTKNFRAARWGLAVVLVGYSALLGWHAYLYVTRLAV